ncbi:PREDICTED: uncharacterized protein LOC106810139 [Priapulus caudatus]|uniref:Uncharacterized protein LOC106810139 n=1 Tax=Priapulus caudatus TaxID=37621 RepID=A0ABM1E9N5_PRICU|nr:PREDICTED: uncharacterized protein LOC106810139 [Priapulus caudatus]
MACADSHAILDVEIVDVREADLRSPNMEIIGMKRALDFLKEKLRISEVVTDHHPQITAYLRRSEPQITHQLDVWHASKNLAKKITAVGINCTYSFYSIIQLALQLGWLLHFFGLNCISY